jgi:transposase-like protein
VHFFSNVRGLQWSWRRSASLLCRGSCVECTPRMRYKNKGQFSRGQRCPKESEVSLAREFKVSAAERADCGESAAALSREFRVPKGHLYKWCGHFQRGGSTAGRTAGESRSACNNNEICKRRVGGDQESAGIALASLSSRSPSLCVQQRADLKPRLPVPNAHEKARHGFPPGHTSSVSISHLHRIGTLGQVNHESLSQLE